MFGVLVSMLTNAPDSASTADKSGFLQVVNRICFGKDQNKNRNMAFGSPKMNESKMHIPSENTARPQQCHLILLMQPNASLHLHPRMI